MPTFSVVVRFRDGLCKVIEGVAKYGVHENGTCFYIVKNGYSSFFVIEEILYIGRQFDLEEK